MKKHILASLVGGILIFVWQALSWTVLPIHHFSTKHTPNQDTILSVLKNNIAEEGMYYLPSLDMKKHPTTDEHNEFYTKQTGKPWAMITYHFENPGMDPMQFVKGILINILSAFLVVLILTRMKVEELNFVKILGATMLFPLIVICQGVMTDVNWWSTPSHFYIGTIIDLLMGWLLAGCWFGFYLNRN